MAHDEEKPHHTLEYDAGAAASPPLPLAPVGCAASALGAVVFGIVLPCGGFLYAMKHLDDLGGPLFWPLAAVAGAVLGAVVGFPVGVVIQLLVRHFGRR